MGNKVLLIMVSKPCCFTSLQNKKGSVVILGTVTLPPNLVRFSVGRSYWAE